MATPEKGPGRPEINIDWKQVDQWLMGGMKGTTIAEKLHIHPQTFYSKCEEDHKTSFTHYARSKIDTGNDHIKYKIFHKGMNDGNMTALLHMAKHRLGEWDKAPVTEDISPKQDDIDKSHEIMLLKAQIKQYQDRLVKLDDNKPETGSELCGGDTPL